MAQFSGPSGASGCLFGSGSPEATPVTSSIWTGKDSRDASYVLVREHACLSNASSLQARLARSRLNCVTTRDLRDGIGWNQIEKVSRATWRILLLLLPLPMVLLLQMLRLPRLARIRFSAVRKFSVSLPIRIVGFVVVCGFGFACALPLDSFQARLLAAARASHSPRPLDWYVCAASAVAFADCCVLLLFSCFILFLSLLRLLLLCHRCIARTVMLNCLAN